MKRALVLPGIFASVVVLGCLGLSLRATASPPMAPEHGNGQSAIHNPQSTIAKPGTWEHDNRATQDTSGAGQNETYVAANPHDPDNAVVVAKDYRGPTVRDYIDATTDAGQTWLEQPFPYPGPEAPTYSDPAVFFRQDGRAYITWMGFSQFGSGGLYLAWSDDKGITWSPAVQVTPPTGHYDDKEWLTFGQGSTMYMSWVRFGNSEIYSARSTDAGVTWSDPVQVSIGEWAINNQDPKPVVLPDGTLLIFFIHPIDPGGPGTEVMVRSTDGGVTFTPGTPVMNIQQPPYTINGEHWRLFTFPSIARDPVRGWLSMVWNDYTEGATNGVDILLSRSTDDGNTWSTPVRLNDDPPGVVRDQWFPEISAAPDGRLTALWLDRRDDPSDVLYYAYARTSTDGGVTWLPSERIASTPSDPGANIPPGSDGIGDYIGLSSGPGVVWASWVDVRNGDQDIYAARELFIPQATPTATVTPAVASTATPTPTGAPPSPSPTECAVPFSDVSPQDYFYEPVRCLYCLGVISGYADGTFRPWNNITRGQISKMVSGAAGFEDAISSDHHTYTDVPNSNTFWLWIERLTLHNVMSGYPCGGVGEPCDQQARPYFRWAANATRGQLSKIVSNAASIQDPTPSDQQTFEDVPSTNPFWLWIERLATRGVIGGYQCGAPPAGPCKPGNKPYFLPFNNVTRGQASKIVANTFHANCQPPLR